MTEQDRGRIKEIDKAISIKYGAFSKSDIAFLLSKIKELEEENQRYRDDKYFCIKKTHTEA
jgi:hypothetical protein